ncbi:MAG: hypothetical protein ACLT29_03025 [Ruminococcus callidus]
MLDKQGENCYTEDIHSAGERRWCIMKKALTGRKENAFCIAESRRLV